MAKCFKCKSNDALHSFLIVGKTPTGRPKPETKMVCKQCLETIDRAVCDKCGTENVNRIYGVFQEKNQKWKKVPLCENCKKITPIRGNVFFAGHIPSMYQYTEQAEFILPSEHIIIHCKNENCQEGFLIFGVELDQENNKIRIQQMERTSFCPFCGKENHYAI